MANPAFQANTPACLIGMEARCGSHHIAREAAALGHEVRLIPAQFVRPFVKSQKNDYVDVEAIAEAVQRPTMRFVPVKTIDQLDLQAIHRVRDRLIERRTSVINQLRAFLLERGVVFGTGRQKLLNGLPALLAEAERKLSPSMFRLLGMVVNEWRQIEADIDELNNEINRIANRDAACQRLLAVPGVGPLTATAMIAAVGNGAAFSKGRRFAAWLGLVPKQVSTGGEPKLLGISKRGNAYLRRLFIHGARSVIARANLYSAKRSRVDGMSENVEKCMRSGFLLVAVLGQCHRKFPNDVTSCYDRFGTTDRTLQTVTTSALRSDQVFAEHT